MCGFDPRSRYGSLLLGLGGPSDQVTCLSAEAFGTDLVQSSRGELRLFRDTYRAALERWRQRMGPVHFPEGTYKMCDYPGVVSEWAPPVTCQAA